jgi:tRNA nucleotidyltransferase (CCA-adding enzyme)
MFSIEPLRRFLITDEPDVSHPGSELLYPAEPILQKLPVLIAIFTTIAGGQTQTLVLKFPIPEMSADALHPQLLKTVTSICEKIEMEEFSVFNYDYWTAEERFVIFTIELNVFKQGKYYIHKGPKVWPKKACDNFKKKWQDALYPLDEFMVLTREREFKTAKEFLEKALTDDHIHIFKIGKNIKEAICSDECVPIEIDEFLNDLDKAFDYDISNKNGDELARDYLNSLDDFLNPGQYIKR